MRKKIVYLVFLIVLCLLVIPAAYRKFSHPVRATATEGSRESKGQDLRPEQAADRKDEVVATNPGQPVGKSKLSSRSPNKDQIPKGTRQKAKGDRVTACTPAYEAVIEFNSDPTLIETFSLDGKVSDPCMQELRKVVKNLDQTVKTLVACGGNKSKTADQQNECLRLASVMRTAFVENEFKGTEPSDLPSPVLRSMLAFRALQMNDNVDAPEAETDYFYRLASEEQKLSPDSDLAPLRSYLISRLVQQNPEKYDNEFDAILLDIERKNPDSALSAMLMRYKTNLKNDDLKADLEGFLQRNPANAYGYYVKAAMAANREEWPTVDPLMVRAISLAATDREFYDTERQKFARKEKSLVVRTSISISL